MSQSLHGSTPPPAPPAGKQYMSTRGATFLGVGAMVGAGIFALLGEAGAIAGSATWVSFLLAGLLTMLLGYTTVKLGVRYPSSGGFIAYLKEAFGNGHLLGICAWLGYFAMVITVAMVAVSFGSYTSGLLVGTDADPFWGHLFTTLLLVGAFALNILGSDTVDKAQSMIVFIVLAVFAVFIASTLANVDSSLLARSTYPAFRDIVASIALTFFAFLGFGVITFSAGELRDPARELPRAMYLAIGIATAVYVLVSLGVFGALTVDQVIANGSTAIAEAAKPTLGDFGFTMMSLAAMFATAGCTNANLYAANHLTSMLGTIRQFPPSFSHPTRRGFPGGLTITAIIVLFVANLLNLTEIASVGTTTALTLFLLMVVAGIRLRALTGASILPMAAAIVAIAVILAVFVVQTLQDAPRTVVMMVVLLACSVLFDFVWKRREAQQAPHTTTR